MNKMKRDYYKDCDEVMYTKVLDNGLTVHINPKVGFNKVFMSFIVNFGANDIKFIPYDDSKYIEVPLGVAHFLEHKMFEMPNGIDATTVFESLGAESNAFTDAFQTAYIASCTSRVEEVLKTLIEFVQTPYFTDDNVLKEQGIIIEEYKMYQDYPSDRLYSSLMKNMFKKNLHREDVVGNVESIKAITKEILYKCYYTFYHPKNMYLCISGDVNVDRIVALIEDIEKNIKFVNFKDSKRKSVIEENVVFRKSGKLKMDITMPRVSIGVKLPVFKLDYNKKLKLELITKIMLENSFGFSSSNYQFMLDEQLVNRLSYSCQYDRESSYIRITANSFKSNDLIKYITNILLEFPNYKIDDDAFDNIKKAMIGSFIRALGSEEYVASSYIEYELMNCNIFDSIQIIRDLKVEDINEISKYFIKEAITNFVILPN